MYVQATGRGWFGFELKDEGDIFEIPDSPKWSKADMTNSTKDPDKYVGMPKAYSPNWMEEYAEGAEAAEAAEVEAAELAGKEKE